MFFLRLHFQNYGTVGIGEPMGIQVLSGVHFLEVLANCFRCAMKIPVQSRHALIISGCDTNSPASPLTPARSLASHIT
ncbi:hypothetical protein HanHA89_Chr16g0666031 [Helianthus annuus]|nr:hypothetical protein HanHA89_Chr16g0666031 [Helianthus annuus]